MIAGKPSVLVVDDDPVSLRFLAEAIRRCGCMALPAGDARTAFDHLSSARIDLLLIDRCLADCEGAALLSQLRARGVDAPAIASSAQLDRVSARELHDAGFADTLAKPTGLAAIHALLRRFVPIAGPTPEPRPVDSLADFAGQQALIDDAGALTAIGGDRDALRALRDLFAAELEAIIGDMRSADVPREDPALAARLHRLRASCGFCGAPVLAAATLRLERELRSGTGYGNTLAEFVQACTATRDALAATG